MSEHRIIQAISSRPHALLVLLFAILAVAQIKHTLAAPHCAEPGIECALEVGDMAIEAAAELEAEEHDPELLVNDRANRAGGHGVCRTPQRKNLLAGDPADDDPDPD